MRSTRVFVAAATGFALSGSASAQCVEGCLAIHTLLGEAGGDQFGWVSSDVGDLDEDGVTDFIIGAPGNDAGGNGAGRAYVYSGASGTLIFGALTGSLAGAGFGTAVGGTGDIDGDQVPDVIVGAPSIFQGEASIFSGADGSLIHTFVGEAGSDSFGFAVNGAGDFNGDGTPDVVIGATRHDATGSNAGRAYVYSGADFTLICSFDGFDSLDRLGSSVDTIGDVTGDGWSEVVVGAQNAGSGGGLGYVYTFEGSVCAEHFVLDPGVPSSNFGLFFADGGGDVNGDGTPDIYVSDFSANRAHIFSGTDGQHIHTLSGTGGFGIGRIVDDVNGDGKADLILAAWTSGEGAPGAGKAFVYSGADAAILETFTHNIAGANFGFDANGLGDVNDDGLGDYLITAASDAGGRGTVYVIAGTIAPPIGDLDGDGHVGITDFLLLLADWGPCDDCGACPADLDGDCAVGITDFLLLLANWG